MFYEAITNMTARLLAAVLALAVAAEPCLPERLSGVPHLQASVTFLRVGPSW